MEKEDGRKLAAEAQFERRKQAVRLHKQGKTPEQIAEMLGMGHVTARSAIKIAEADGIKALAPKKRGRPSGSCRQLSEEQEAHIQRLICEKRPEQMKMDFALWTRAAVMALIKQELAIELPVRNRLCLCGRCPLQYGQFAAADRRFAGHGCAHRRAQTFVAV